ncbi:MAG: sigma 54-interacting transcriptional regulator [Gemmatimonadota bacterium]|nr:sigma 54-interacting transcriptional regulator [Gemmatimonadota bacterium]
MPLLTGSERAFLEAVSRLAYVNPFLPERIDHEREVLGPDFREGESVWRLQVEMPEIPAANPVEITQRVEAMIGRLRESLAEGSTATVDELALYEDAALYALFYRYYDTFVSVITEAEEKLRSDRFGFYSDFLRDWKHFLQIPGVACSRQAKAPHFFALFYQVSRGFHYIFRYIVGGSTPAVRLRAAVWQSIFTHDMRRHSETLYERMDDVTTLITGPTGTGKELVARAVGLSHYIPFNPKTKTFAGDVTGLFHALNLSALAPTLIESELFGHRRGAFTGAVQDRQGWLEVCQPGGTVFLDEIGDLDSAIQVKLLRVLETRTFQPVGDTVDRHFHGKIVAATNRDLAEAMRCGEFREDFYYRMCSDVIVTPSLYEQLRESPAVLGEFLRFIARKVSETDADALAEEAKGWIVENLGREYEWPGNFRELEQCVRSVLIHGEYQPPRMPARPARQETLGAIERGAFTADELLSRYCTLVYSQTGNYQETARRLGLDRRTVKSKVDEELLARLLEG